MTKKILDCKTLNKFSMSSRINRFNLTVLSILISFCLESNPAFKGVVLSMESTFWENRTKLNEARNMFSQFDDADFNEEDYIDSYDTWIKHGMGYSGQSSYISQLRTINEDFNRNATSGISEDDKKELSSFLDLVNEYEDIKSDMHSKSNFIKTGSNYYNTHPLQSQSTSDDSEQNMTETDFLSPLSDNVNITRWAPFMIPLHIESWNASSDLSPKNTNFKSPNKSEDSLRLKEFFLNFVENRKRTSESWNKTSNYR